MVHAGWSALSVGFLALYLAFSINQASSNGVQETNACESFQPTYGGALLHHVYQTLGVQGSIYCLRTNDPKVYMKKFRKRSRRRRFGINLVSLFSRIKPGFQVGYCMKVVVMVTFHFRLLVWKERHRLWKIIISRRENSHKTYFYFRESKILLIVLTLILRHRNWS